MFLLGYLQAGPGRFHAQLFKEFRLEFHLQKNRIFLCKLVQVPTAYSILVNVASMSWFPQICKDILAVILKRYSILIYI
jgi:hypothetical protein